MYFQGGAWTQDDRENWKMLTGSDESTTRVLGNLARKVRTQEENR